MKGLYFLIATVGVVFLFLVSPGAVQGKQVVGWIEKVSIHPGNLVIRAKMDTGVKNSSLNASNIAEFERGSVRWARFNVTSRYGKTITIERKVHRMAKIKRHGGRVQLRYSIHLGICLGDFYREAEVNLVDRSGFIYQMLIGRSFMTGNVIVDPSIKYTKKQICKGVLRQ